MSKQNLFGCPIHSHNRTYSSVDKILIGLRNQSVLNQFPKDVARNMSLDLIKSLSSDKIYLQQVITSHEYCDWLMEVFGFILHLPMSELDLIEFVTMTYMTWMEKLDPSIVSADQSNEKIAPDWVCQNIFSLLPKILSHLQGLFIPRSQKHLESQLNLCYSVLKCVKNLSRSCNLDKTIRQALFEFLLSISISITLPCIESPGESNENSQSLVDSRPFENTISEPVYCTLFYCWLCLSSKEFPCDTMWNTLNDAIFPFLYKDALLNQWAQAMMVVTHFMLAKVNQKSTENSILSCDSQTAPLSSSLFSYSDDLARSELENCSLETLVNLWFNLMRVIGSPIVFIPTNSFEWSLLTESILPSSNVSMFSEFGADFINLFSNKANTRLELFLKHSPTMGHLFYRSVRNMICTLEIMFLKRSLFDGNLLNCIRRQINRKYMSQSTCAIDKVSQSSPGIYAQARSRKNSKLLSKPTKEEIQSYISSKKKHSSNGNLLKNQFSSHDIWGFSLDNIYDEVNFISQNRSTSSILFEASFESVFSQNQQSKESSKPSSQPSFFLTHLISGVNNIQVKNLKCESDFLVSSLQSSTILNLFGNCLFDCCVAQDASNFDLLAMVSKYLKNHSPLFNVPRLNIQDSRSDIFEEGRSLCLNALCRLMLHRGSMKNIQIDFITKSYIAIAFCIVCNTPLLTVCALTSCVDVLRSSLPAVSTLVPFFLLGLEHIFSGMDEDKFYASTESLSRIKTSGASENKIFSGSICINLYINLLSSMIFYRRTVVSFKSEEGKEIDEKKYRLFYHADYLQRLHAICQSTNNLNLKGKTFENMMVCWCFIYQSYAVVYTKITKKYEPPSFPENFTLINPRSMISSAVNRVISSISNLKTPIDIPKFRHNLFCIQILGIFIKPTIIVFSSCKSSGSLFNLSKFVDGIVCNLVVDRLCEIVKVHLSASLKDHPFISALIISCYFILMDVANRHNAITLSQNCLKELLLIANLGIFSSSTGKDVTNKAQFNLLSPFLQPNSAADKIVEVALVMMAYLFQTMNFRSSNKVLNMDFEENDAISMFPSIKMSDFKYYSYGPHVLIGVVNVTYESCPSDSVDSDGTSCSLTSRVQNLSCGNAYGVNLLRPSSLIIILRDFYGKYCFRVTLKTAKTAGRDSCVDKHINVIHKSESYFDPYQNYVSNSSPWQFSKVYQKIQFVTHVFKNIPVEIKEPWMDSFISNMDCGNYEVSLDPSESSTFSPDTIRNSDEINMPQEFYSKNFSSLNTRDSISSSLHHKYSSLKYDQLLSLDPSRAFLTQFGILSIEEKSDGKTSKEAAFDTNTSITPIFLCPSNDIDKQLLNLLDSISFKLLQSAVFVIVRANQNSVDDVLSNKLSEESDGFILRFLENIAGPKIPLMKCPIWNLFFSFDGASESDETFIHNSIDSISNFSLLPFPYFSHKFMSDILESKSKCETSTATDSSIKSDENSQNLDDLDVQPVTHSNFNDISKDIDGAISPEESTFAENLTCHNPHLLESLKSKFVPELRQRALSYPSPNILIWMENIDDDYHNFPMIELISTLSHILYSKTNPTISNSNPLSLWPSFIKSGRFTRKIGGSNPYPSLDSEADTKNQMDLENIISRSLIIIVAPRPLGLFRVITLPGSYILNFPQIVTEPVLSPHTFKNVEDEASVIRYSDFVVDQEFLAQFVLQSLKTNMCLKNFTNYYSSQTYLRRSLLNVITQGFSSHRKTSGISESKEKNETDACSDHFLKVMMETINSL